MRILCIDVEVAPATAVIWDLKTTYVNPGNILSRRKLICAACKWIGEPGMFFFSFWDDGHEEMVKAIYDLVDEADAVVHYNGQAYDMPMLNTEFALAGLPPPSPYSQIDLMKAVKKNFRFMSNKLDYITGQLGVGRKADSGGMATWLDVMSGDEKAREKFREYNQVDVELTELLYKKLLPWIPSHPSRAIIDGDDGCPSCGGQLKPRGYAYTRVGRFRRFRCDECGGWSRSTHRDESVEIVGV